MKLNIENRKARFNYEILKTYECGIVLKGAEIKSIRQGHCSIGESFCYVNDGCMMLKNSYIKEFNKNTFMTDRYDEYRERQLLLHKKEICDLASEISTKGYTIVPLRMYTNKYNIVKVEIALCRGKKDYDKRETIKKNDSRREIERAMKNY